MYSQFMKSKNILNVIVFKLNELPQKLTVLSILIFTAWITSLNAGEYRTFKSNEGVELRAKVVSCKIGEHVTLERADGRLFKEVPWPKFSTEDQGYLKKWIKDQESKLNQADLVSDAKLKIKVIKGIDDDFNEYGDIDDHEVYFKPAVIVESDELYRTFTEVQGTLIIIGHGYLKKSEHIILSRQSFKMDFPAKETARWDGSQFSCVYDPDYGGFDYAGYLLVLRNRSGEIIIRKASNTIWEDNAEQVIRAKERMGYNRKFTEQHKLRNSYGLPN